MVKFKEKRCISIPTSSYSSCTYKKMAMMTATTATQAQGTIPMTEKYKENNDEQQRQLGQTGGSKRFSMELLTSDLHEGYDIFLLGTGSTSSIRGANVCFVRHGCFLEY
jgi:hypothetical protein